MPKRKSEPIQEYVDSRGLSLAAESGVLRGVKILGMRSRNGREYPKETIARAIPLYEGAKVNVDHTADPATPRSYADRFGVMRNVRLGQGDTGLFADFHYNPKHALAEQLEWDAQHSPENVGFSHNIHGRLNKRGDTVVVEDITRVVSVDLVADPATTRGLFEGDDCTEPEELDMADDATKITLESLKRDHKELYDKVVAETIEAQKQSEDAKKAAAELAGLREEVDRYKAAEALRKSRDEVDTMLAESKLPADLVTDIFRATLYEATAERRTQLIEDRKKIAERTAITQPRSVEQRVAESRETAAEAPKDSKEWASRLKG